MAWKRGTIGAGDDSVEAAGMGGGLQAETRDRGQPGVGGAGKHTLGCSWGVTLGRAGSGECVGRKASGAVRRHDSKISLRMAIASTWEILVEGAAPASAPATTCRPWTIQSSVEGAGTERQECWNSTVLEIT
jgi:hypothetical protein